MDGISRALGSLSPTMWALLLVFFFVSQVVQNAMFVAQMAFFAKVGASLFAGE